MNKADSGYALNWAKKIMAADILGGMCQCGEKDIVVLEFHHHNDKKELEFNVLRSMRWSLIEKEIKNCTLLCSNCHVSKHTFTKRTKKAKEKLFKLFGSSSCEKCEYDGPGLNFHHISGTKEFDFGQLVGRKISVTPDELMEELSKCSLLCPCCHIKEHFDYDRFNKFLPIIKKKMTDYKECPPMIDRQRVHDLLSEGHSKASVARMIGCAKSTISYITNG